MVLPMAESDLTRAWRTNARITLELLEAIPEEGLEARYSPRTRTVAAQFAHLHYVRVRNLDERGPRESKGKVAAFENRAQPTHRQLVRALQASGRAMTGLFESFAREGKVKSWGEPPESYLGYHCAHEAHHRGLVIVSLRLSGIKLANELRYSLWSRWRKPGGDGA